jgi:hypothetical protein
MSNKPKTPVKHILSVLKMPMKISDKIVKAQFIQKSLTGNANFPVPYPSNIVSLAQLDTDIAAMVTTHTNARSKTVGTADVRNASLSVLLNDLRSIMQMVQAVADKTPATAETIIIGAGYDVKKTAVKQKQNDAARTGKVSGDVIITAKGAGPHEWQMSKDKVSIINLDATSGAKTTVNDLTPGDVWYFRSRPILKKGIKGDWSDWIIIRVR